ncbi:unnamed protein product [Linum trigynum]|uniref:Peptidase A1 domain-containing protein n=1 Tax=Linum trigynum TaxID=586398 RepID=A0AAV2CQV0_9ROSI
MEPHRFDATALVLAAFVIITLAAASPAVSNTTSSSSSRLRPKGYVFPFIVVQHAGGDHTQTFQIGNQPDNQTTIPVNGGPTFFVAKFSLGNPPQPQKALIDSGSSLTWLYCQRDADSEYKKGMNPSFRLFKSSTFRYVACNHPVCADSFHSDCHDSRCIFMASYHAKGEDAVGYVSIDTLKVNRPKEGTKELNFTFGCNVGTPSGLREMGFDGILGVGPEKTSIVSQLGGGPLAMCFGPLDAKDYRANYLAVGEGVELGWNPAPMSFGTGMHYYVRVVSVFLGQTEIKAEINGGAGDGIASVDSGSSSTVVPDYAYTDIKDEIKLLLDAAGAEPASIGPNELCYLGRPDMLLKAAATTKTFPSLFINLEGGSRFELPIESLFQVSDDGKHYCLWLIRSSYIPALKGDSTLLIGINAFQFHRVVFDSERKQMSVEQMACRL